MILRLSRHARAAAFVTAALALAACSDSPSGSTPKSDLTVQIAATMSPPRPATIPGDTTLLLQCDLTLHATATGKERVTAQWGTGIFRFYAGPNRTTAIDSFTVSSNEIAESWGASTITAGVPQQAQWTLTAGVPFAISADFEYTVLGASTPKRAHYEASCGPSATGTAVPSITNLQVSPASGPVEAGSILRVSFDFTAAAGAWETEVYVNGAVAGTSRTRESFATSGTRTVNFTVPAGAEVDVPLNLYVRVTDALLRPTTLKASGPYAVVDHTPPTLLRATSHSVFNPGVNNLGGQFAAGDSIQVDWIATDNNALEWLGWGIDGPVPARDSVRVSTQATARLFIRTRPEWAGATALRFWVADRAGNHSAELVSPADSFGIFPVRNRPVRSSPAIAGNFTDAVLDPATGTVYIASDIRKEIAVFSLTTMTFGTPIPISGVATSLDLTPSGDSLVAALPYDHALAVIPLATRTATTYPVVVPFAGSGPSAVAVGPGGRIFATGARGPDGAGMLMELKPATGDVRVLYTGYAGYTGLARTPDRSRIFFVADCRVEYRPATDQLGPCVVAEGSGRMEVDASGAVFTRGQWAYAPGLPRTTLFPVDLALTNTAAPSPDGTQVFLSSVRGLLRAKPDGHILDRSPLPQVYGRFLFTDGGATLVAITGDSVHGTVVFTVDLR
jgi:hypothetical protein